jgi:hypothetical protein
MPRRAYRHRRMVRTILVTRCGTQVGSNNHGARSMVVEHTHGIQRFMAERALRSIGRFRVKPVCCFYAEGSRHSPVSKSRRSSQGRCRAPAFFGVRKMFVDLPLDPPAGRIAAP